MQQISVTELKNKLATDPEGLVLIDVRDSAQHNSEAIPEAENVPVDSLESVLDRLKDAGTVYVHCNTGNTSSRACKLLAEKGVNVVNVEGGISAWKEAGFETEGSGGAIPMVRQVMIAAGSLVLAGVALGYFVSPWWYLLSAGVGGGLFFSGVTGMCGMSKVLGLMPWNR